MPESTLSLAYIELIGDVGAYLGYGRGVENGEKAWTASQRERTLTFSKGGLRQFYYPPPLEPGGVSYQWSFLRPVATLTLASGSRYVDAPDDYAGLEAPGTIVASTSNAHPWNVQVTGIGAILGMYSRQPGATGQPRFMNSEPLKGITVNTGQRYRLNVFPEADQEYEIRLAYQIAPDFLTGSKPYAYGGPMHAQTLLQSCLAMAEAHGNDAVGTQRQLFMERLAASISLDRALQPQRFGRNIDRSDERYGARLVRDRLGGSGVTFNGEST